MTKAAHSKLSGRGGFLFPPEPGSAGPPPVASEREGCPQETQSPRTHLTSNAADNVTSYDFYVAAELCKHWGELPLEMCQAAERHFAKLGIDLRRMEARVEAQNRDNY